MPTRNISLTRELQTLHAQLELGVDALRRGEFDEVDGADLHAYLQSWPGTRRIDPDGTTQRETRGKERRPYARGAPRCSNRGELLGLTRGAAAAARRRRCGSPVQRNAYCWFSGASA